MKKLILTLSFLLFATNCFAASRYWVGGGSSANWTATGNTNWGTASNTQDNASVPTTGDDAFFDGVGTGASNCTFDGNVNLQSLDMTGYTNTLTWNTNRRLTFNANGSNRTVKFAGTLIISTGDNISFHRVTNTPTYLLTSGGLSLPNLNIGNTLANLSNVTFQDNITIAGTGSIFLNRGVLDTNGKNVQSTTLIANNPQSRTLTFTSGTWTITGNNATVLNFNISPALLPNITYNRGGTFNFNYSGSTGTRTIDFYSKQTGDVNISAGSDTVSIPNFYSHDFNLTGFTGTLNDSGIGITMNGSLTLGTGMTLDSTQFGGISFLATDSGSYTITTNGVSLYGPILLLGNGGTLGATYTLQDTFTNTAQNGGGLMIIYNANTLNTNGKTVNLGDLYIRGTLTLGASTLTLSGIDGLSASTIFDATTAQAINAGTSTIIISDTTTDIKTFTGYGFTYNILTVTGDNVAITGNNTFNTLNVNNAGLTTGLIFKNGTTQTVTTFTTNGFASNLAKILSDSAGVSATLKKIPGGKVCVDYMSIKDSKATGGAWSAGTHSTDVSGNTGWLFSDCEARPMTWLEGGVYAGGNYANT